jgi:hypothetical protein
MFKAKVRIYKNVNWEKHHFKKNFHDEKSFNEFVDKNPDLKALNDWELSNWPDNLFEINNFFDEAFRLWNKNFFKEMEEDVKKMFEKSKKLLEK